MQTQITGTTPVVPPPPKAPKPRRARDPFRRNPLACALMDAVAPIVERGGDQKLKPGYVEIDIYRALLPVCRDFTVADAARAFLAINPTTMAMHHIGTDLDRTARMLAREMLESFMAVASPSSPDDIRALARHLMLLEVDEDTKPVIVECLRPLAATTIFCGIESWMRGDFSAGETFGSAGDGSAPDGWCRRVAVETNRIEYWFGGTTMKSRPLNIEVYNGLVRQMEAFRDEGSSLELAMSTLQAVYLGALEPVPPGPGA